MAYTHSPPFRVLHTAPIAVGASVLIRSGGYDSSAADAKYAPFNQVFVQNFDSQPLELEYGLGRKMRIPGGMSMEVNQPGIDQIRITNAGTAITSEPIEIIYQLRPTVEDLLYASIAGIPLDVAMRR